QAEQPWVPFQHLSDQERGLRFLRPVNDPCVAEVTDGVGLGPEADFALRKRGIRDVRHRLSAIEKATDPVAGTLDGEFMPEVGSNLDGRTDGVRVPSIDKF